MFPLRTTPVNAPSLQREIAATLAAHIQGRPTVTIAGDYPQLSLLAIDLTNTSVDPNRRHPPMPGKTLVRRSTGPTVAALSIAGKPVLVEGAKVHFALDATSAEFTNADDPATRLHWLVLDRVAAGRVQARLNQRDLEQLVFTAANAAGQEKGVNITSVDVELQSLDARSIGLKLTIEARKLFVTASIVVTGQARVDEQFTAQLSALHCSGSGVVGSMLCPFIQSHLDRVNNRSVSLLAMPLGGVKLKDLKVDVKDGVAVSAEFA